IESTDNAYVQGDISPVSPKIQGYVREVRVVENQRVKAGDVLVTIEDRDYAAKVAQAEAQVDQQKAAIATFDNEITQEQAVIDQAVASVASAEADRVRTQLDLQRYRQLAQSETASRQRLESAEADARKNDAALVRAKAAVTAERGRLPVLGTQKQEAAAKLAQLQAALDLARIDLDDTVIRAPIDGVVGNRSVQVGQLVKAGTQLLAVVPLPQVYITANFKETQLARMRPGQKASIAIDAFPDQPITGTVESFAPASGSEFSLLPPENATGNFTKIVQRLPVRIAVPADNPLSGLLRPGLSVVVDVDTRDDAANRTMLGGILGAPAAAQTVSSR
ncbi:MAG TPA: HlyD family secretion protein, partial [Stellaceae bacterium]|nr:HlyD family secretion protein [Stellaceae bacterium]